MFDICLFDLDETLLRTDDLREIREAGKNVDDQAYHKELRKHLAGRFDRRIYSQEILAQIRKDNPEMKLGIFTRSPRSYALTTLEWGYPGFQWDIVVAYEDVKKTKPYGEGIDSVLQKFGKFDADGILRTILVGDGDVDVRSAYHCGCLIAIDKSAWPGRKETEHWRAIQHVADAIIQSPEEILEVLSNPLDFLPALERALSGIAQKQRPDRFDELNHFFPAPAGSPVAKAPIFVCGRSFAKYDSIEYRRQSHILTQSIEDNKLSDTFPEAWIETVRAFIAANYRTFWGPSEIVVAVVPRRPERKARLENFLTQLAASIAAVPIGKLKVTCQPNLFAYKEGVKSQHKEHLNKEERFSNVRDHLYVQQPEIVRAGKAFLVIDDVVTTGASLLYSQKYLQENGATDVKLLAIAKNIGKLFND